MVKIPFLLSYASAFTGLSLASTTRPNCQSLNVTLDVTSQNANITLPEPTSTSDLIDLFERFISLNGFSNVSEAFTSGTKNISGTYSISTQLCVPGNQETSKNSTVQFLTHGITFDKTYWDFPLDPANYSYVQAMNEAGYTTFALDLLGLGQSSTPDPISAVQTASQVEIVRQLTEKLRQGTAGFKGVGAFDKVIHVGHSYGSIITNALVAQFPNISDAVVLTGYSHNATGLASFFAAKMFDRAKTVNASQFASLPGGYLASSSGSYGNELAFFQIGGFNQQVADLVTETALTVTIGELLTLGLGVVAAPEFNGPVLTITGQNDLPFCAGSCFGTGYPFIIGQEAQFWPASSNFTANAPLNTGHGLNLHFSAPDSFKFIIDWLGSNGF